MAMKPGMPRQTRRHPKHQVATYSFAQKTKPLPGKQEVTTSIYTADELMKRSVPREIGIEVESIDGRDLDMTERELAVLRHAKTMDRQRLYCRVGHKQYHLLNSIVEKGWLSIVDRGQDVRGAFEVFELHPDGHAIEALTKPPREY